LYIYLLCPTICYIFYTRYHTTRNLVAKAVGIRSFSFFCSILRSWSVTDFRTLTFAIRNWCTNARFFLFFVARLLVRLVSLDVELLTIPCNWMLCICQLCDVVSFISYIYIPFIYLTLLQYFQTERKNVYNELFLLWYCTYFITYAWKLLPEYQPHFLISWKLCDAGLELCMPIICCRTKTSFQMPQKVIEQLPYSKLMHFFIQKIHSKAKIHRLTLAFMTT
jgi:hypothetical protein